MRTRAVTSVRAGAAAVRTAPLWVRALLILLALALLGPPAIAAWLRYVEWSTARVWPRAGASEIVNWLMPKVDPS
jgi:hypothetical protein